eukprot:8049823-Pyramimonas_sp.AAC.1
MPPPPPEAIRGTPNVTYNRALLQSAAGHQKVFGPREQEAEPPPAPGRPIRGSRGVSRGPIGPIGHSRGVSRHGPVVRDCIRGTSSRGPMGGLAGALLVRSGRPGPGGPIGEPATCPRAQLRPPPGEARGGGGDGGVLPNRNGGRRLPVQAKSALTRRYHT